MWCSALAHCQKRFEGKIPLYKDKENSGGLGCFTPDNFPVFDVFRENVYVIADSNHGYKMIGVGKLVAQELMGEKSALAGAVPVRALRQGRIASDLAQPVSLELRTSSRRCSVNARSGVKTARGIWSTASKVAY